VHELKAQATAHEQATLEEDTVVLKKKTVHNKRPKLPHAMQKAMEKITKKATQQALASATRDNLHRAAEHVAAQAVVTSTHANIHQAKKAVQAHIQHLKKVQEVKEQEAKAKAKKYALKRAKKLHRLGMNMAARDLVLHSNKYHSTRMHTPKLYKIKAKIMALKSQEAKKASGLWAKMKAKADRAAVMKADSPAAAAPVEETAAAKALQAKLEHQEKH